MRGAEHVASTISTSAHVANAGQDHAIRTVVLRLGVASESMANAKAIN